MTADSSSIVSCPECNRRFRWTPQAAGKQFKCKCGQLLLMPETDPAAEAAPAEDAVGAGVAAEAEGGGETAEAASAAAAPPPRRAPVPGSIPASALLFGTGKSKVSQALEARVDDTPPTPIRDKYLPIITMIVGVILTYVIWALLIGRHQPLKAVGVASIVLAMQVLLFVPLALFAAALGAKMMGIGFGELVPAILKLAAVTLCFGTLCDSFLFLMMQSDFDMWYPIVALGVYIIVCGIPLALWFGMDVQETALVVTIQAIPRIGLIFGMIALFPGMFGKEGFPS